MRHHEVIGGSSADHDLGSLCRSLFRFAKEVGVESVRISTVLNCEPSVQPYNISDLWSTRVVNAHWETLLFVFSKSGNSHAVISATPDNQACRLAKVLDDNLPVHCRLRTSICMRQTAWSAAAILSLPVRAVIVRNGLL